MRLTLADARTAKPVDAALGNTATDLKFDVPPQESRSFAWQLKVPDGMGFLTYKAVGSTGRLSDGEEGFLPVLSRRILVTESLPLPIRGPQTKKFDFTKLRRVRQVRHAAAPEPDRADGLQPGLVRRDGPAVPDGVPARVHRADLQPAVRQRPGPAHRQLGSQDPTGCSTSGSGTPALDSPLEKNQDLKAVMLEETPWLRQAQAESQARRNVGILFDDNRLNDETARLLRKLAEQQLPDGAWPWFPGGPANDYITLYITTGFGRLRHLGVDIDVASAVKSLQPAGRLDRPDLPRDPEARRQGQEPLVATRSPCTCTAAASS